MIGTTKIRLHGIDAPETRQECTGQDGKETYTNTVTGDCTTFFKPVYWSRYTATTTSNVTTTPSVPTTKSISTGTGFFINADGYVVTNHHVIDDCGEISVKGFGAAQEIVSDAANDISVLRVVNGPRTFANLRGGDKARLGETVIAYGFPYVGALSQDGNLTQGNISAMSGLGNDIRMYQMTAPVQPGNSGGALLDSSKNVVGVVTSKLNAIAIASVTGDIPQNVNFAIKGNILESVLEINGIDFTKSDSTTQYELVDVAETARKFTALIVCQ